MKKMDEMERNFADHSIRIAYMMMFLMLWSSAVFQHIRTGAWNFDFFVVNVVTVVQIASYEWFKHRADSTDKEPGRVLYMTIAGVAIVLAIGVLALMRHGNKIRTLRTQQHLTQQELADAVNVTRQTINAIENNKYDPTLSLAFALARQLQTTVDHLFQS